MPCCGTTTQIAELTDEVGCETCNVVLELGHTYASRPGGSRQGAAEDADRAHWNVREGAAEGGNADRGPSGRDAEALPVAA